MLATAFLVWVLYTVMWGRIFSLVFLTRKKFVDLTKINSFRSKCNFQKWAIFGLLVFPTFLWYYLLWYYRLSGVEVHREILQILGNVPAKGKQRQQQWCCKSIGSQIHLLDTQTSKHLQLFYSSNLIQVIVTISFFELFALPTVFIFVRFSCIFSSANEQFVKSSGIEGFAYLELVSNYSAPSKICDFSAPICVLCSALQSYLHVSESCLSEKSVLPMSAGSSMQMAQVGQAKEPTSSGLICYSS